MSLHRHQNQLYVDEVSLTEIAAGVGTPAYVYSWSAIAEQYRQFDEALSAVPHQIHYAVKANSNLAILHRLASIGSGFDIVSGGELERVLRIQDHAQNVVFSGVGKSREEIEFSIKAGVGCINVESAAELTRIEESARMLGCAANVAIRINPDIDANTHPYITTGVRSNKFGVPPAVALDLYRHAGASPHLEVVGVACHLGSQIAAVEPFHEAVTQLLQIVDQLSDCGISVSRIDIGGGFGIRYENESEFDLEGFSNVVRHSLSGYDLEIAVEPGRSIVGEAGILLTRVEYLKPATTSGMSNYAIVDAAMTELVRPALYGAYHDVQVVSMTGATERQWNVVGPVCESGDFLAQDRILPLESGSLLAICTAGAYGSTQGSNYNSRPKVPEVLVDGSAFHVVRQRESMSDVLRYERIV